MIRAGTTFTLSLAIVALTLGFITSASAETFYRWNDERGNPVHSDRPPPKGVDYEVVSTDTSLIRSVEGETGAVPKDIKSTPSNEFETVETKPQMLEKNPEYCARARENLSRLDTDARIRMRNDQGEVRYLDEEERALEREKAISSIEAYCE